MGLRLSCGDVGGAGRKSGREGAWRRRVLHLHHVTTGRCCSCPALLPCTCTSPPCRRSTPRLQTLGTIILHAALHRISAHSLHGPVQALNPSVVNLSRDHKQPKGTFSFSVPPLLPQALNPSETFGEIIVDYNHVECSSACITALTAFAAAHPEHRAGEIAGALRRGVQYLKR